MSFRIAAKYFEDKTITQGIERRKEQIKELQSQIKDLQDELTKRSKC